MSGEQLKEIKEAAVRAYEAGRSGRSSTYIRAAADEWCTLYEGDPLRQEIARRCESVLLNAYQIGRKEAAQCQEQL